VQLEQYLCIGGVEVANGCRTLAYLQSMNYPHLRRVVGSCCCPGLPEPVWCEATIDAGFDASDPEEFCTGVFGLTGFGPNVMVEVRTYAYDDCPGAMPALPDADDPGWDYQLVEGFTFGLANSSGCWPYGEATAACGFSHMRIIDAFTGAFFDVIVYIDIDGAVFGDPGESRISFDLGETWLEGRQEHTIVCPCVGSINDGLQLHFMYGPGKERLVLGTSVIGGGVGPYELCADFHPGVGGDGVTPLTVAQWPGDDDPGWLTGGCETFAAPVPLTGATWNWTGTEYDSVEASTPPSAFYRTTVRDLGSGYEWVQYGMVNFQGMVPGDLNGSMRSADGGDTWTPITPGLWHFSLSFADDPFTTPEGDDAPWYDPARPESADVLGVWLEEFTPEPVRRREMRERSWGGTLSGRTWRPRELTMVGYVYAKSRKAAAYAEEWLERALDGAGCFGGPCGEPDAVVAMPCDCGDGALPLDGYRTAKRVGLTDFQVVDPGALDGLGFKFQATLSAEVPYLYHDPIEVADLADITTDPDTTDEFCAICSPCDVPAALPCNCGGVIQPVNVAPQPDFLGGYCRPAIARRRYFIIDPPYLWTDATLRITLRNGETETSNLALVAFPNPLGITDVADAEVYAECVDVCMSVEVACLPGGGELVIDGTTRTAKVTCGNVEGSAYPYLSTNGGRFAWPDVGCQGMIVAVEFDPSNTDPGLAVKVELVPRDQR
jgi:hypothetical protein